MIDPDGHRVKQKVRFPVRGLRADQIQPEDIAFTPDDAVAFVALGPANRVAVVDAKSYEVEKYLLVGQRVWHLAFTPDHQYLLTTNGLTNDVSVIDAANRKVIRSIGVGRQPWGVAVSRGDPK